MLLTILAVIVVLSPIVLIHEFGHFIVCRMSGIRVNEFAFGLGKKVWSIKKGDTEYSIRAVPFGGFVSPAGEMFLDKGAPAPKDYEVAGKKWYIKLAMVLSGAFMNYVLAFVIFAGLIMYMGKPAEDAAKIPPVIGSVVKELPAQAYGLQAGDKILTINNASITNWAETVNAIKTSKGDLTLTYDRNGQTLKAAIPAAEFKSEDRVLGITVESVFEKAGVLESVGMGAYQCWFWTKFSIVSIYDSLSKKKAPDLAGPVGIVNIVHDAVRRSAADFIFLIGLLSLAVGMFNLFPIPVLDGGYAVMFIWEGIWRKPLSFDFVQRAVNVGFVLLMMLVLYATHGDIKRIFVNKKAKAAQVETVAPAEANK